MNKEVSKQRLVYALRGLSVLGAVAFSAVSIFVYRRFPAFALLPVGVVVGFALYAVLGTVDASALRPLEHLPRSDPRLPGVLTVVFFVASAAAVFTLSEAYYSKPLVYYLTTALAAAALTERIIFTDAHYSNVALALLFGLNTFFSNQLAFPLGLGGPDIGTHLGLARNILTTGHIVGDTVYTGFPGQHALSAAVTTFVGTELAPTYRFIGVFGMFLGLPLTYLLACRFVDRRFAPLAMVVYASMDYVVYRAGHPSKLAYALPLLFFLFTCALYLYEERKPGIVALFALFAAGLSFTHHHTALVALLMLLALALGQRLATMLVAVFAEGKTAFWSVIDRSSSSGRMYVLPLLLVIAFIGNLLYFSGFFDSVVGILEQYVDVLFVAGGSDTIKQTPRFSVIPIEVLLINTIGSGLLILTATFGILRHIKTDFKLSGTVFIWLIIAGMIMIFGVVANVPFALPQRVFVITQMSGIGLFAAVGIVYLIELADITPKSVRSTATIAIVILVTALVFFSTASTVAGIETSPFNEEVGYRTWYSMTEEQSAEEFLATTGVNETSFQWTRNLSVTDQEQFNYSQLKPSAVFGTNTHRINTGISVESGSGHIGTGGYAFPDQPQARLTDKTNLYDNGVVDLYINTTI